jgi:hypothetical protein
MPTALRRRSVALVAAGLVVAATAAPAHGQSGAGSPPPLAAGIRPAADWAAPKTSYVVANSTALYRAPVYDPAEDTGLALRRGERPQVLAEANQGLWLLVGRGGRGVGYAPRSLLCPTDLCPNIKE